MTILSDARKRLSKLHHKFTATGKILINSSQKWLKLSSAASSDCDVIVTFPSDSRPQTVPWLVSLLRDRVPQLVVRVNHHVKADERAIYLTSSYRDLLHGAEAVCLRKRILPEFGGGYREFSTDELDMFENVTEESAFLTSQERQTIVLYWLRSLRAKQDDKYYQLEFTAGQSIVPVLQTARIINQVFPLHNRTDLEKLSTSWVQAVFERQPLKRIEGYFGVKIALYFAWLGHYTTALIFPTAIGIIGWMIAGKENYDLYYLITSICNILWATLYLEHWKRTSSELTYRWGTLDYPSGLLEECRPFFKGDLRQCPITGRVVPHYPDWKRQCFVYLVSLPITVVGLLLVVGVTMLFADLQTMFDASLAKAGLSGWLSHLPKVVHALVIGVMDDIYKRIAVRLNDLENHRLEESYRNYLIAKLILFQFMNSFFPLLHCAFYLQDLVRLREHLATLLITRQFIGNVKEVLLPYFITKVRQVHMGFRYECQRSSRGKESPRSRNSPRQVSPDPEVTVSAPPPQPPGSGVGQSAERPDSLPLGMGEGVGRQSSVRRRRAARQDEADGNCSSSESSTISDHTPEGTPGDADIITQAEEEATMPKYDDPFEDFLEMFIQFGYVSLFGCAFPLAGLFCLVNNVLEIRSDAFKLTTSYQRPFGVKVGGIGVWQFALELVSAGAVVVNMALLGLSGGLQRIFPGITPMHAILLTVLLEHVILVIKFTIAFAIPDVPSWVEEEIAKVEYRRRKALKMLEKEAMREQRRQRSTSRSSDGGTTSGGARVVPDGNRATATAAQAEQTARPSNGDDATSSGSFLVVN